ncbi:hypothetical protein EV121DRAFT_173824, partial [Schizophyllum commune]
MHNRPLDPTPDTLSLFTVYMSHHIKPQSVDSYLSAVCNQCEPFFPDVRKNRKHPLVARTLAGCKKLRGTAPNRKRPLNRRELAELQPTYAASQNHDDMLFWSLLLTGFHGVMRLGELVAPDRVDLRDYRKIIRRSSVRVREHAFEFFLPGHKADRFFEGNHVVIPQMATGDDPLAPFQRYLASRDGLFPYHPELWLRASGQVPTRGWFIRRLRKHFNDNVAGHSLRSGGATALAEAGYPPHLIQ